MSYIGRSAKLSRKAQEKVSFLATAGQTVATGLAYVPTFVEVILNGSTLTDVTDYTATDGNSITFLGDPLTLNDEVTIISLKTFALADHYNKSEADALLAAKATVANFTSTGIDDNATAVKLTVADTGIDVTGTVTADFYTPASNQTDPNDGSAYIYQQSGVGWDVAALNLKFSTGASGARSEAMRIDSSGNVGIGTSSPTGSYGGGALHVHNATGNGSSIHLTDVNTGAASADGLEIFQYNVDAYIKQNETTGSIRLYNAGTERMRIDSSGIVTKPYQPAFGVRGVNFTNTIYRGSQVLANIGSHFSTTTGRFTVPVAGSYSFNFTLTTQDANSQFIDLYKNGASTFGHNLQYTDLYRTGSMTIVVWLAVGDYIEARQRGSYAVYNAQFSGHLIG